MNDHRNQPVESITAETCPRCAAHLEDTWTGEECGRCGFKYLVDADANGTEATTDQADIDPFAAGPSIDSAAIAILLGVLSGGAFAESGIGMPVLSESGIREFPSMLLSSTQALFGVVLLVAAAAVIVGSAVYRGPSIQALQESERQ